MANVKSNAAEQDLPLYAVYCTECGRELTERFFPIDRLLREYSNSQTFLSERDAFIHMMGRGIGAVYGEPVLPQAKPLMSDDKFVKPSKEELDQLSQKTPPCFLWEEHKLPKESMIPISLNIASLVAQFYQMTGFYDIYRMLELRHSMNVARLEGESVSLNDVNEMDRLCNIFAALGCVKMPPMTTKENRMDSIETVLDWILASAEAEAKENRTHFATEEIRIGWGYKLVNNRKMPYALAAMGTSEREYHSTTCYCRKCFQSVPYDLGAYEQRVVGLLGTQATGKTTYLAALADAINKGELITLNRNGRNVLAEVTITACIEGDAQWAKVSQDPTKGVGAGNMGLLWLYQHGFPPAKTPINETKDTASLTFLVSPAQGDPVMYTIADISGEAFFDTVAKEHDETTVAEQKSLLNTSRALIQVISVRQMDRQNMKPETGEAAGDQGVLVDRADDVLTCYKNFLRGRALRTAVVLTSCDEINGGNLRKPMHLAFDPRNVSPLLCVQGEGKQTAVLNRELLHCVSHGAEEYVDRNFGGFMGKLRDAQRQNAGKAYREDYAAAFPVSSGTQKAPIYFGAKNADEQYCSQEAMKKRCEAMRLARFGVGAPLLWLLAQDGMLRADLADKA